MSSKEMHPTTAKVLKFVKKFFSVGDVLSYSRIAKGTGIATETARQHVLKLAKRRLVSLKAGHIVKVK